MMEMMNLRVAIDKMILVRYKTFSQRIAPIIRERFVLVTFKNLIEIVTIMRMKAVLFIIFLPSFKSYFH